MSNVKSGHAGRRYRARRGPVDGRPTTRSSSAPATTASSRPPTSRGPGWRALVLERAEHPGGAVRSEELTRPGLRPRRLRDQHEPLPRLAGRGRARRRARAPRPRATRRARCPFANVFPDGAGAARARRIATATLAGLRAHDPRDADGWEALDRELRAARAGAVRALRLAADRARARAARRSTLAPARCAAGAWPRWRASRVSSTRELAEAPSALARGARRCWPAGGCTSTSAPDVSGGAMFPFLEAFTDMRTGISIARGGASRLVDALVALLREAGGELRLRRRGGARGRRGRPRQRGRARGRRAHRRAPRGDREPDADAALRTAARRRRRLARLRRSAAAYAYGPGTMMVHLALARADPVARRRGSRAASPTCTSPRTSTTSRAPTRRRARACCRPSRCSSSGRPRPSTRPARPPASTSSGCRCARCRRRSRGDALGEIAARDWDGGRRALRRARARQARALRARASAALVLRPRRALARRARAPQPEPGRRRLARRQHAPAPELRLPPVSRRAATTRAASPGC